MLYNVYTISIGNAMIIYSDDPIRGYITLGIESRKSDESIELGFMDTTSKSNSKRISTNNFSKLLSETTAEVFEMFMGERGFFRNPGENSSYPIHQNHLELLDDAIEQWETDHKDCKFLIPYKGLEPDDFEKMPMAERIEVAQQYDWVYANLIWLQYWFDRALQEDYPSILIKPMML